MRLAAMEILQQQYTIMPIMMMRWGNLLTNTNLSARHLHLISLRFTLSTFLCIFLWGLCWGNFHLKDNNKIIKMTILERQRHLNWTDLMEFRLKISEDEFCYDSYIYSKTGLISKYVISMKRNNTVMTISAKYVWFLWCI